MTFGWPIALVGLIVVPIVLLLYIRRDRDRATFAKRFGNPALMPNLVDRSPKWRRHLPFAVLLVALAALVVGVARPHATVSVKREQATVLDLVSTWVSGLVGAEADARSRGNGSRLGANAPAKP